MKVNAGPAVGQKKDDYRPEMLAVLSGLSHEKVRDQLRAFIDFQDTPRVIENGPYLYRYILEVFDNYFIYEEETQDGTVCWRRSYSVDAEDKVVVSDDKTQVQKRVEYVPVTTNANKENTMADKNKKCCPDRVASLIANAATTYTAEDGEWLSALTETQLEKLEAPYKANEKADEKPIGGGTPAAKANEKGTEETPEQKWEAFMNAAPAEFRAVINAGTRALDAKRADLMGKIKANAKNTFTDDELKAMPDVVLEKMAGMAAPETPKHDYSGRGGAFQTNSSVDEEEAYVPVTINFAKDKGEAGK